MISVGIVGGTGYTGVELLRLLALHPQVELKVITSRAEAGQAVTDIFPNLRGVLDLVFSHPDDAGLHHCDLVFFATPNGTAMHMAPALLDAGVKVIDLSADYRLTDPELWERWYKIAHASPALLSEAVYGLPELHRERIRSAWLIANPGCYPTATILGFLPLLEAGNIAFDDLIADTKSGVSGAGRKAEIATLLCEAGDSLKAYSVSGHRHLPEITQCLAGIAGNSVSLTFVPHLTPMIRGIHATLYANLHGGEHHLQELYAHRYRHEPFVDVLPPGCHPETRSVRGANTCRLAIHRPGGGRRVVILSVIDNLVKGAAGQAVQNMNLMFGFDETLGLKQLAVLP